MNNFQRGMILGTLHGWDRDWQRWLPLVDTDPLAWEMVEKELCFRITQRLEIPSALGAWGLETLAGLRSKPHTKSRNPLRDFQVYAAVEVLKSSGMSQRKARQHVAEEIGKSIEAVNSMCRRV